MNSGDKVQNLDWFCYTLKILVRWHYRLMCLRLLITLKRIHSMPACNLQDTQRIIKRSLANITGHKCTILPNTLSYLSLSEFQIADIARTRIHS
jgi:hypothetical protein